ncbi:MAG: HD domain-containing protein [Deltaproteobacteria bacterium]|jgi:tRNA nucleotidyltransferase (CCA-adding enzyme)|nr:HD domain-containing protein [Deltaproteobacteria bacterium]
MTIAIFDNRLVQIAESVKARGGRLLVIGGLVRDALIEQKFGLRSPSLQPSGNLDKDLVAFGVSLEDLKSALSWCSRLSIIDHRVLTERKIKEPTVLQVRIGDADFSITLARRKGQKWERHGEQDGGHDGWLHDGQEGFIFGPSVDFVQDALSRDFTVNAVYFDPLENRYIDPLGGLNDLDARRLELCSLEAIADDPLRLMRAMAFISRLGFTAGPKLLDVARKSWSLMALVPGERLWPEWRKWALSKWPRFGLDFFKQSGLANFWPDFVALTGSPQLFKFHPEGDVWTHTLLVVEALSELDLPLGPDRVVLTLAALLHDIGKPLVTFVNEHGRVSTKGHTAAGMAPAGKFLKSIMTPSTLRKAILKVVEHHMDLSFRERTNINLKVLAKRLAPFCDLEHYWAIAYSDWNGRSPCPERYPWTLEEFLEPVGGQKKPGPIPLETNQLMASLGLSGGPIVGRLMDLVTEAFDKSYVTDAAQALELAATALADPDFKVDSFFPADNMVNFGRLG